MFQPHDLVSEVLTKYPGVFMVFERHGMCADCKMSPPPVPIRHFVNKHCNGRIQEFLEELNAAL